MKSLKSKVAVVTGAASGIGRATSERLAAEGCDLALVDLDPRGLADTADRVRRAGRRVSVHQADVADKSRMSALPDEVLDVHGAVHILINNAGVTVAYAFEEHSLEDFEWIVGVNLWGTVYGCKFFLPHLRGQREAHIVNVSSMAGLLGLPMQSSYCATKFAVRGFTESLAAELAQSNVGVSVVFPGPFRTNVLRSSRHAQNGQVSRLAGLLERYARPPADVAERIVSAIRGNRLHVRVGAQAYLTDFLSRSSPSAGAALLGWGFAKARSRMG